MATITLICAFVHTLFNGILIGSLMNDIQDAYKNSRFNRFLTILFLILVVSIFSVFMVELFVFFMLYNFFTGDHFKISKYKLYILGLNIYFHPYVMDEYGEKQDLYEIVANQPYFKIKKFWLFDVVYLDKKYCKENNLNIL